MSLWPGIECFIKNKEAKDTKQMWEEIKLRKRGTMRTASRNKNVIIEQ